jgi:hypothetical protein
MTPHYSTPEFELLKEMSSKQDRLIERLFGDLDAENPRARFPALEQHQHDHGKRLTRLENDRIRVITFTSVVSGAIGFLVELFIHGKL